MIVQQFLDYLRYERNRSPLTVENYGRDLDEFVSYLKTVDSQLTIEAADADLVRGWMEQMMDRGQSATSVNRRLSALRSFFRFALAKGLVEKDPVYNMHGPKMKKALPQFLRENEMNTLLDDIEKGDTYKDVRARTILMTFYETGIRVSELVGLNDASLDTARCELRVRGKGNKERVVPYGRELSEALDEYRRLRDRQAARSDDALFVNDKGERLDRFAVYRMVREALAAVTTLRKKSPHVLRHTFATAMLNNGAGIESIRKLLGHAKIDTTEIYTHTTFEQLQRVYKHAHPRA